MTRLSTREALRAATQPAPAYVTVITTHHKDGICVEHAVKQINYRNKSDRIWLYQRHLPWAFTNGRVVELRPDSAKSDFLLTNMIRPEKSII